MLPTARQEDALRELVHLGSAKAASMLSRLVGDVGVLVDVPALMLASQWQLAWLFGGRDIPIYAVSFGLEGDIHGALWWVLPRDDAQRLGRRLLRRPGVSGPLASNINVALAEAANIVASACVTAWATMLNASLLPSTPSSRETTVASLIGPPTDSALLTVASATFVSTNSPTFGGWLVLQVDDAATIELINRLGV